MKHITFAEKSLFVDDDAADCLVEYATLLGAAHSADSVRIRAIGTDGNEVEADFVLNQATNLMSESTTADMEPPENTDAVAYMRGRIEILRNGVPAHPADDPVDVHPWNAGDFS
ncbi:hypothetical protein AB3M83_03500 [Microbacterium sp. 179-B 1A2 NHS]|uniref:hypothetical protein n=1 Tax=Microbacterium sp. 179-B 1A2 NHS TaxID=3142383 RepID=UPI0039A27BCF